MSDRSEMYESLIDSWSQINQLTNEVEDSHELENNSALQFARLLKVISYLDFSIRNIDYDLLPLATLTKLRDTLNSHKPYIEAAFEEESETNITRANQYIDSILLEALPFLSIQINNSNIQASKSAFNTYIEFIDTRLKTYDKDYQEKLNDLKNKNVEVSQLYENVNKNSEEVEILKTKLLIGTEDSESIETDIDNLKNKVEEQASEVNNYFNSLFTAEDSTKSTIDSFQENIREAESTIRHTKDNLTTELEELEAFYREVFGQQDGEEEVQSGLRYEIQERKDALDAMKANHQTQYNALKTQIEDLIPGATSASLASAYRDLSTSFIVPIRIYTGLFVLSIVMLLVLAFYFTNQNLVLVNSSDATRDIAVVKDIGVFLLQRLPIILPIIWLAIFASKRRSEAERLKQEYAHKEALAKSYQSFKQQIEKLGEEAKEPLLEKLLDATIVTIAINASNTLDRKHGDNAPLHDLLNNAVNKLPAIKSKE